MFHDEPFEILLVAKNERSQLKPLLDVVPRAYVPNRIFVEVLEGRELDQLARKVPALAERTVLSGNATAFICELRVCRRPTSDPDELATQLARNKPLLPDRSAASIHAATARSQSFTPHLPNGRSQPLARMKPRSEGT